MLTDCCPPSENLTVADVAAGTGLFTQGLLNFGYRVVAVEPNTEMRAAADQRLAGKENYRSVGGSGEAMSLPPAYAQLITVAQAFHWFDAKRTRKEFRRVLTPQGQVLLVWNDRVLDEPLHQALDALFDEFGGAKRAALVAHESNRAGVVEFFAPTRPQEFFWPHSHQLNQEGLLALVFSRSYMPARRAEEGRHVEARIREVFDRFAREGTIEVRYQTVAFLGRLI